MKSRQWIKPLKTWLPRYRNQSLYWVSWYWSRLCWHSCWIGSDWTVWRRSQNCQVCRALLIRKQSGNFESWIRTCRHDQNWKPLSSLLPGRCYRHGHAKWTGLSGYFLKKYHEVPQTSAQTSLLSYLKKISAHSGCATTQPPTQCTGKECIVSINKSMRKSF